MFGEKDHAAILDLVNSNHAESRAWRQSVNLETEFKAWYDQYRSIPPKSKENWMSNKFYPMTQGKVETAVAQICQMLMSINPMFRVKPREMTDEEQSRLVQQLLQYQFDRANVPFQVYMFVKSMCIYGTAIGKVIWDWEWKTKTFWKDNYPQYEDINGNPVTSEYPVGQVPQRRKVQTFSGPVFVNCNINDIYLDPNVEDMQKGFVIHEVRRSIDYLRQMHENYPDMYNKNVLRLQPSDANPNRDNDNDATIGVNRNNNPKVTRPQNGQIVRLHEWWGDYPVKGDDGRTELTPCVFTVAENKYVIRAQVNPFFHGKKPFVKACWTYDLDHHYGIGVPEQLEDLQNEINENVNQRSDNVSLSLNPMFFYKKDVGIDTAKLVAKPGGVYGVDEDVPNAISVVRAPDVTQPSFAHVGECERMGSEVTGITPMTMGISGKQSADTATGQAIQAQNATSRFWMVAKNIEQTAIRDIVEMFYALNYQFITQDEVVRVVGPKGVQYVTVSPDDVRRNYDFVVNGVMTMENSEQAALRLLQFYNITKGNPRLKEDVVLEKLYMLQRIGDDPNEILKSDEEIMAEMQAQLDATAQSGTMVPPGAAPGEQVAMPGMGGGAGTNPFVGGEMVQTPGVPPVTGGTGPSDAV